MNSLLVDTSNSQYFDFTTSTFSIHVPLYDFVDFTLLLCFVISVHRYQMFVTLGSSLISHFLHICFRAPS